ncbi:hypothetical protein Ahy_B10g101066 [Arachis hypogaea]|uniref:Aminotransferase-like plant mobile domain-containing protein n=1 Tax=Arachis hypogaea TaxID=3818 RepID=A0A444WYF3_ARAHY|nr:hypothetical protein Ahy_B10g101066 [Arachis hypogaea]
MGDDPERLYRLDGVAHIVGVINDEWCRMRFCRRGFVGGSNYAVHVMRCASDASRACGGSRECDSMRVNCTWFQETFGECLAGADKETVRRFTRAYIMMLLGTQLFANKSDNRIHIRWLPYVVRLQEMGGYSWGSAALAWLYRCMCQVANRHVVKLAGPLQLLQSWIFWRFPGFRPAGYDEFSWPLATRWSGLNPSGSEKGPRVQMWRLGIDMLQARDFIWMPYSYPDVLQVVHPEVLEPRHTALWWSMTSLIYFAVIEWHQVDRVLPQFDGVQHRPHSALNIDFLMSKDGRGGDRWFPYSFRADHVLQFDVVADPGPSHDFLDWWSQHGKRFLSPEMYLGDPRAVPIPVEATQRGAGRVPDMDRVDDVPDRRRVERRARVGTRRSQREWRWLDQAMDEDDADEWYGSGMGDVADQGDGGLGSGPLGDYFVGVPVHDQTLQESTTWYF